MTTQGLRPPGKAGRPKGAVLLALMLFWTSLLLSALLITTRSVTAAREERTAAALAEARDALIGFAATYPDTHRKNDNTSEVPAFGYLPCPAITTTGSADGNCGSGSTAEIGRLPWKTLGIPPLRDASGECLWYLVASGVKNNPKNSTLNWDTLGQFIVVDRAGNTLAGATAATRPLAIVLAPGPALRGQDRRSPSSGDECGGSLRPIDYLEELDPNWNAGKNTGDLLVILGNDPRQSTYAHNDQGAWIDARDLFDRAKQHRDFKDAIDTVMNGLTAYLNTLPPKDLPASATNRKITTKLITTYLDTLSSKTLQKPTLDHWRDHFFYARNTGKPFSVKGVNGSCPAVLVFGGERTATQTRSTTGERNQPEMYLEGDNAKALATTGQLSGSFEFSAADSTADIVRCITGQTATPPAP